MGKVVEYGARSTVSNLSSGSGGGGGSVDDISRRLSNVETSVSEVREQVSAISAIIPHLATKADLGDLKASVVSMESAIIKWIVATVLTSTALAFTIAKFVH